MIWCWTGKFFYLNNDALIIRFYYVKTNNNNKIRGELSEADYRSVGLT